MTQDIGLRKDELRLAREAAEWRLLSLLFECPTRGWRQQVSALVHDVADEELKSAGEAALQQASEGLFHHIFGPGGPAPPREATYHQTVQLGYLMAELQAYYDAFAFHPVTDESPDHISVETAFIAYLKLKEAYALARGDKDQAATASESAQRFILEHLANMAQPFANHLEASDIPYLMRAGSALFRRVGRPPSTAPLLPILQEEHEEGEWTCGETIGP